MQLWWISASVKQTWMSWKVDTSSKYIVSFEWLDEKRCFLSLGFQWQQETKGLMWIEVKWLICLFLWHCSHYFKVQPTICLHWPEYRCSFTNLENFWGKLSFPYYLTPTAASKKSNCGTAQTFITDWEPFQRELAHLLPCLEINLQVSFITKVMGSQQTISECEQLPVTSIT